MPHIRGIPQLTAEVAVVEEAACRVEVHCTYQAVLPAEEACPVEEVPACPEVLASQVAEDRPFPEEARASSEEDPSVSARMDLACPASVGEVPEVVASAVREDLARTPEEALASSAQEDASQVVRPAVPALDEARIALEAVDRGVSLREWDREGVCK